MKVALYNPKYPHNVGAALRACSCWGADELIWSGDRVPHPDEWLDSELKQYRIPREERMKGYNSVKMTRSDRFKNILAEDDSLYPICVELSESSENLFDVNWEGIENPMFIFGPEDGSVPSHIKQHCYRFIQIPTRHCLNLACAVNVVLSNRSNYLYHETGECEVLAEQRDYCV